MCFSVDSETLKYLELTGRELGKRKIIEDNAKTQLLWHDENCEKINYSDNFQIDLSSIEPCVSGPKRPQDKINLRQVKKVYYNSLNEEERKSIIKSDRKVLSNGKVCLAAVTSCTNTSNPSVLLMAGLLAKSSKIWNESSEQVKTSFAPGSKVVKDICTYQDYKIF